MISYILSKIISMCMGLLYPAYCSYKAVKTKNVKEYVHWMMYWIVFSIFSFFEVFVDMFIGCWFPFYYEFKIIFILWMLSPTTRGGSVLYRRVIHPMFTRHEHEIDAYLADFKLHASNLVVRWGTSAFNYITEMIMGAVLRAGAGEHPFFKQSKRSFSLEGFDDQDMNRNTHQLQHDDSQGMYSDTETAPTHDEGGSPQRRQVERIGSVERDTNRVNILPKPYSMMNLGLDELDDAQPPKLRSSSRKKKEFGNYTVVTSQDMAMPLVFGWYPPPNVAPDMNTAFIHPSMYPSLMSHPPVANPVEVAHSETMETFLCSPETQHGDDGGDDDDDNESGEENNDVMESETDSFFDCEMETDDRVVDKSEEDMHMTHSSSSPVQPIVQHVSKTNLQAFDTDSKPTEPLPIKRRSTKSKERDIKRNSMSALQSKSGLSTKAVASDKSKVRKSLSDKDLKLVKPTSIWSTSSFRRVLNPFSSSPPKASSATNLKRSGSNASSASVKIEKKRKAELKTDN